MITTTTTAILRAYADALQTDYAEGRTTVADLRIAASRGNTGAQWALDAIEDDGDLATV